MNLKRLFPIFFISIFLITLCVFGEKNISNTSAMSGYPAVAVNQNGIVLAVWTDEISKGHEAGMLYYNVYENGQWSGAKNAGITQIQAWSPQFDVDSEGNFHIAYADGKSSLNREIYHAIYYPESGWSSPTMIWKSPENSAWQKIDIDNDRIYIVWHHENSNPYRGHDIIMQSKKIEDLSWPSAYERISWTAHDNSTHPAFKVLNERVYVCYMEGIEDRGPWRIFFKEAKRGSSWQGILEEEVAGKGYRPELEVDDQGNVHIVWASKTGNYMYRRKVDGNWKATEVISNKYSKQQFGDLRYKNDILVATWVQRDTLGESAYYASKVIGEKWEKPIQIAQGSHALFPRIWLDDNGYGHFVWHDSGEIFYEKIVMPLPNPFLQLSTNSLLFTVESRNPEPISFNLKNLGEESLNYEVNVDQDWLSVTPSFGSLDGDEQHELQCDVDAIGLDNGTYTASIEISSSEAINSPQTLTVTLEVLSFVTYPSFLQLSTNSLFFTVEGQNPEPISFNLKNLGEESLNYEVNVDQDWLSVTPSFGSLDQEEQHELQCDVDAIGLGEGTYTASIEVSSSEAINSPQTLTVTLEVLVPVIYPPLNFTGELLENKALFYREYMHHLTWEANPLNKDIGLYRLYEIDGVNRILLQEFSSSTFEYRRRHVSKDKIYTYELWAVDNEGYTGSEPAILIMSGSSSK